MIKNEERIIERSLKSVENIVDAFCVCDTGSTDNTVQIVKKFLETHTGCITEETWRDFGHNRTLSFVNAQTYVRDTLKWDLKQTYGILLDADMVFVPGKLKEQTLGEVGYAIIQENKGLSYHNCRIVRMDYSWKCLGVTHEYWDGPTQTLSKDICYIDDRDDGGCKGDKFIRDAMLLERGLKEEPKNVRYMFYLAQTYNSLGRNKDSIKMYKKRIEAGGWEEEVWYSHYMIAQNHKCLGNIVKFEEWMLRAYEKRKTRAEPLYKLTEHFRIVGQQYKAYEYARIGKNIPYPTDVLFIEKQVYDGLFDYEMSILDYYVHTANGTRSSMTALLKCPQYIDNIVSNLKFYAKPIRDSNVTPLVLPNPFGEDFNPSAISIVKYPYANVRYVNYWMENGNYLTKNNVPVQTQNAYVNLERIENVMCMKEDSVGYFKYQSNVQGLEDVRVSSSSTFLATSVNEYVKDTVTLLHGTYNMKDGTYDNVKLMKSPNNRKCEKNWLFLPNSECVIYDWYPFQVGKLQDDTLQIIKSYDTPPFFSRLRGSASPVKFNDNLVTLVHFIEMDPNTRARIYYHCFVMLEKDTYRPIQISLPFVFESISVEYCICITIENGIITCYVSFKDANPTKVVFNYSHIEWISI